MSKTLKVNTMKLSIYIAERGWGSEKKRICEVAGISRSALDKLLREEHVPNFPLRLGIYKATGIKVVEEDEFPPLEELNAS